MTGPKVSYKAEEEQSWDAFGQVEKNLKTLIFFTHKTPIAGDEHNEGANSAADNLCPCY